MDISDNLPDSVIQNLMVLSANALAGKPHQGEPEQMAELWQNVAQAKKYLTERAEAAKSKPETKEDANDCA